MKQIIRVSYLSCGSVHLAVGRLLGAFVCNHFILEMNEYLLHGEVFVPFGKGCKFNSDLSVWLIYTGNIDLWIKEDVGGFVRIGVSCDDSQKVNTSVESSVGWANDRGSPVSESLVAWIFKSIRNGRVWKLSFLFKLFVEPENAWRYKIG